MPDHQIGTREEWQAARAELAKLEAEHAQLGQRVTDQRRQLPWVPVEKEYEFDTEDGKKTLAAPRLQHHVRARLRGRRLPGVFEPGRRARRHAGASRAPRRDAHLLLAR